MKVLSFNANGLGDRKKRVDVLNYLKNQNANIIMLQETHWITESENSIRDDWGFECYVNGNSTNRNGVSILFCNNFEFTVHKVIRAQFHGQV